MTHLQTIIITLDYLESKWPGSSQQAELRRKMTQKCTDMYNKFKSLRHWYLKLLVTTHIIMPELAVTLHFIMPALKIALFASIIFSLHIQLQIPMIHNSCKILTASCKNSNLAILFAKILHKFCNGKCVLIPYWFTANLALLHARTLQPTYN